jgi:hypothetical protein
VGICNVVVKKGYAGEAGMMKGESITMFMGRWRFFSKDDCRSERKIQLLQSQDELTLFLVYCGTSNENPYLFEQFSDIVSRFSQANTEMLTMYLASSLDLHSVMKQFIRYCYDNNIHLSVSDTLSSFDQHNDLSNEATCRLLDELKPRDTLKILGYGLGEAVYEKLIANYLLQKEIAKEVVIYGYDPYSTDTSHFIPLDLGDLKEASETFDLVTARWVLHHVPMAERWENFIDCLKCLSVGGKALVVEHGLSPPVVEQADVIFYSLFLGLFDTLANIGIRRNYPQPRPDGSTDYFVEYLKPADVEQFTRGATQRFSFVQEDVGPVFPNQNICVLELEANESRRLEK